MFVYETEKKLCSFIFFVFTVIGITVYLLIILGESDIENFILELIDPKLINLFPFSSL